MSDHRPVVHSNRDNRGGWKATCWCGWVCDTSPDRETADARAARHVAAPPPQCGETRTVGTTSMVCIRIPHGSGQPGVDAVRRRRGVAAVDRHVMVAAPRN